MIGVLREKQEEPQIFLQWKGNYRKCGKKKKWIEVVFCAKFCWKWGKYPPCQSLWFGSYYALSGEFKFHVREQEVKDEEEC